MTSRLRRRGILLASALGIVAGLLIPGCGEREERDPPPQADTGVKQQALRPRAAATVTPTSTTPDPSSTSDAPPASPTAPTTPDAPVAAAPNQAPFVQVGTGENHTCGVRSDGSAECWGTNDQGQLAVPRNLRFRKIASGWRFSCGIKIDGTLACWGRNSYQQSDPPAGLFTDVAAGWDHACAIQSGGAVCWGREVDERTSVPPGVSFTAIGAGAEHSCGLTSAGDLTCWGKNDNGRADSRAGPFRALAVGVSHTCVLRTDGSAVCQGTSETGLSDPPDTEFELISAGNDRTCGTLPTGQVECWDAEPRTFPIQTFGPPGAYTSVSVGWDDVCAANEVGQVACWTSLPDPLPEPYNRLLVSNILSDIKLSQPVEVIPWPFGGLAVADKSGLITVLNSDAGSRSVLDLTDVVQSDGIEAGMLSAVVDPNFATAPFLYVFYTRRDTETEGRLFTRLSRFPLVDGVAVRNEELTILDITRENESILHFGGAIRFGSDDMLYLGVGDSECAKCAQRLDTLHGKIIRIDVRDASVHRPYRIPDDNPLLDRPNVRPEIWAFGLRNPWRMAFDADEGQLWIGDVGEAHEEEASIATAGANLGWPTFEGFACRSSGESARIDHRFESARVCQNYTDLTTPLVAYGRDDGCAIIGGVVYRGSAIRALNGVYLFGDYCRGRVWALDRDEDGGLQLFEIADLDRPLSSFGVDSDGEILMLTFDGPIVSLMQTKLGYPLSVTYKARVTVLGPPLDPGISPTLGNH